MNILNVLLVCGSGASSGFMAANMRKAAIKKEINLEIKARSESEIENYIDMIDVLMIGPHLKYLMEEIIQEVPENILVILMEHEYYATLDGEKALEHMLRELKNK